MTVVINAVSAKMGGAATYLRELALELARRNLPDRFVFYVPPAHTALREQLPPNIEWRPTPVGHAGILRRLWWEQLTLRRLLTREGADVLYSTGNFALLWCPVRQLLLIHNALYVSDYYPREILPRQSLPTRVGFRLRQWLLGLSARRASLMLVPSQSLAQALRRRWPEVKPRIQVNPYGVASSVPAYNPPAGSPFKLAYPSLYAEHKNLSTLLRALQLLVEQGDAEFELWTTADPSWPPAAITTTWQEDLQLARQPGLRERVHFVSPEQPESLPTICRDCSLVVYPTRVESFGFPLLESLQAGFPVLAADTAINRELAGDAAYYFNAADPADLAEKIRELWRNPALRAEMSARGRERACSFSWANHVDQLLACLRGQPYS